MRMFEQYSFTKRPQQNFDFNLCIGANRGDTNYIVGTATFIAHNLAITAKHVIVDIYEKYNHTKIIFPKVGQKKSYIDNKTSIIATQFFDKSKPGGIWHIKNVFLSPNTDIAYMLLIPYNNEAKNYNWSFPEIDLHPPAVGSKITAYGFIEMSSYVENKTTKWSINSALTTGIVREIHYDKRDTGLYNYPVLQTNANFAHGMSGGPVYNAEGRLFGIGSGSLDPSNENEEHISYVAMLWPSLITPIHSLNNNKLIPAYNLFNSKNMRVENFNNVELNKDNTHILFRYSNV